MMKNAIYFVLKVLFIFKIFGLHFFGQVGQCLDKKANVNFKIYGVTTWDTNN